MTTANDLISRAYRTAGILGEGDPMSADMAADGLVYLNDLIESLSLEKLLIYQETEVSITCDGSQSYTIGSGGDKDTTRPLQVESAFFTLNNTDYPVEVINKDQYDLIYTKSTTSNIVDHVYLKNDYPLAVLYVYPVAGSGSITLNTWTQLSSLASGTTTTSFPPGYERMLRYNLALEITDEFGAVPSQNLYRKAMDSKAALKRVNTKHGVLTTDLPVGYSVRANIRAG